MNTIELKGVTKTFDGFKALDALDLTVPEGSVYGLVGPNGAGKTTAIRHMTGMLRPDEGQVLLLGEPVWDNTAVRPGWPASRTSPGSSPGPPPGT